LLILISIAVGFNQRNIWDIEGALATLMRAKSILYISYPSAKADGNKYPLILTQNQEETLEPL